VKGDSEIMSDDHHDTPSRQDREDGSEGPPAGCLAVGIQAAALLLVVVNSLDQEIVHVVLRVLDLTAID